MSKILKTENLKKSYSGKTVVDEVNINLKKGEIVGLLGPNGAGKTTTFYMITGMIRPSSGKIFFDDNNITNTPMYQRARMGIGYLAQEPSIFAKLTVENNLRIVLENILPSVQEQTELIDKLLIQFNIDHLRENLGGSLSGGERRRVEICRTLALKPDFILLDEPFAGIDPIAVADIQSIISQLKNRGIGVLITDHNVRETLSITDRAYIINEGEIISSGSPHQIVQDEKVKQIYLGDQFSF